MQKSTLREYTESILIAAILALFIRSFVFESFKIPSGSMENTLLVGDHIVVNKFVYGPTATSLERFLLPVRPPKRHDVVVFRSPLEPQLDLIKRAMALPGESVTWRGTVMYVDGEAIDEPYVDHPAGAGRDDGDAHEIPGGEYYMLGDNRQNSRDSRYWGTADYTLFKGKAILVYWSYESEEQLFFSTGLRERLEQYGSLILHFFTRTRWDRTFQLIR